MEQTSISKQFKDIFLNTSFVMCIFSLLLQQIIVASSTLWIIYLSEAIIEQRSFLIYLTLFIISLFIVFIPGITSLIYLEKSKFEAFNNYIKKFAIHFKNIPTIFTDNKIKHDKENWLTNESQLVINEAFSLLYNTGASFINITFNIIIFGIALHPYLVISYILSFTLLSSALLLSKRFIEKAAKEAQDSRKSMNQTLLAGWDNILIGNEYNLNKWLNLFTRCSLSSKKSAILLNAKTEGLSGASMIAALFPVIFTIGWLFYINRENNILLAALVATLPRQI